MEEIKNAKARRAGGRITINGFTPEGAPRKVVGVDEITFATRCDATTGHVAQLQATAVDKHGTTYRLT